MAEAFKVLAQRAPGAASLEDLYTVPALTKASASSLTVCNRGGTDTTFRVAVAVAAAADDPKQYLYRDLPIKANDTFIATIGLTLGTGDVVRVYGGNANLSFQLFGIEIT